MTIGKTISLGQAFLRKHQKRLMQTRPLLRLSMMDPAHGKGHLRITPRISIIFFLAQLSTAARASSSCTTPHPRRAPIRTRSTNQSSINGNKNAQAPCFTSRESLQLSRQLESHNVRPLDPTGDARLPHQVDQSSFPAIPNGDFNNVEGELRKKSRTSFRRGRWRWHLSAKINS